PRLPSFPTRRSSDLATVRLSQALATASLGYRAMRGQQPKMPRLAAACAGMRDVGSAALGICYVADGRFDLFAHHFLWPWDIAARSEEHTSELQSRFD